MNRDYLLDLGFITVRDMLDNPEMSRYLGSSDFELIRDYMERNDALVSITVHSRYSSLAEFSIHIFFYVYRLEGEILILTLHKIKGKDRIIYMKDYDHEIVEPLDYVALSHTQTEFYDNYMKINMDEKEIIESIPSLANKLFFINRHKSARK